MIREAYLSGMQKAAEDLSYLHGMGKGKEGKSSLLYAHRYPKQVVENSHWMIPLATAGSAIAAGAIGHHFSSAAPAAIGGALGGLGGSLANYHLAKSRLEEFNKRKKKRRK